MSRPRQNPQRRRFCNGEGALRSGQEIGEIERSFRTHHVAQIVAGQTAIDVWENLSDQVGVLRDDSMDLPVDCPSHIFAALRDLKFGGGQRLHCPVASVRQYDLQRLDVAEVLP